MPELESAQDPQQNSPTLLCDVCVGCGACGPGEEESMFAVVLDATRLPENIGDQIKKVMTDNQDAIAAVPDGAYSNIKIGNFLFSGNIVGSRIQGTMTSNLEKKEVFADVQDYLSDAKDHPRPTPLPLPAFSPNQKAPMLDHLRQLKAKRDAQKQDAPIPEAQESKKIVSEQKIITVPIISDVGHAPEKVEMIGHEPVDVEPTPHLKHEPSHELQKIETKKNIPDNASPMAISVENIINDKTENKEPTSEYLSAEPEDSTPSVPRTETSLSMPAVKPEPEPKMSTALPQIEMAPVDDVAHSTDEIVDLSPNAPHELSQVIITHTEAKHALFAFISTISHIEEPENQHESDDEGTPIVLELPDQSPAVIKQLLVGARAKLIDMLGIFNIEQNNETKTNSEIQKEFYVVQDGNQTWQVMLTVENGKEVKLTAPAPALRLIKKRLERFLKTTINSKNDEPLSAEEEKYLSPVPPQGTTDETFVLYCVWLLILSTLQNTRNNFEPIFERIPYALQHDR